MHYANLHAFGLPPAPIQHHDFQGIPIDEWYFPVPGLSGHYLYSNGDISHSFDSNLTDSGFNWIYITIESALNALNLYNEKAKIESDQALNTHPLEAIPNLPSIQSFPPIPILEDSTYIDQTLPDTIVHKLLEPQIVADTFLLWKVISADNSDFALSDSNTIVNVAYKAHFETFQSALFAKLRYERTHRDLMH